MSEENMLPDAYNPDKNPQVGKPDEQETDYYVPGILGWALGDHSAEAFRSLWYDAVSTLHVLNQQRRI